MEKEQSFFFFLINLDNQNWLLWEHAALLWLLLSKALEEK